MKNIRDKSEQPKINELVKSAQRGNTNAISELYDYFYSKIYRYIYFKTGNMPDAEDLTEDVFVKMIESISSYKLQGVPFSSWLFRIAHNRIVDHYRKISGKQTAPLDNILNNTDDSSEDIESKIDINISIKNIYAAMESLTNLQKETLSLRFAAGLSIKETSLAMQKNENAVKALQHAAIANLRNALVQEPETNDRLNVRVHKNEI
jgi:RNA polymerase sigma-70 factor (ECF subfamily)